MKKTLIVTPTGEKYIVIQENRGCWWSFGTLCLLLVITGAIVAYPVLIVPTIIIVAVIVIQGIFGRRSQP